MMFKIRDNLVYNLIHRPKTVLLLVALLLVGMSNYLQHFQLDASAESLILEEDKDLKTFRSVSERYASNDFLILTYTPKLKLFDPQSLSQLTLLRNQIRTLNGVASVVSVMDVPLLSNPPVPIAQLVNNIKTLEDPSIDLELAKEELANSPLYVNMLLNLENNTTALQINFPIDAEKQQLLASRESYLELQQNKPGRYQKNIDLINADIKDRNLALSQQTHQLIQQIRQIITPYQSEAEIHLGGVPMVIDDIISFVKSDLINFGIGVLLFLVVTLWIIFRQIRWVVIPLLCCAAVVYLMIGLLGLLQWQVTVISSNFISLLLILTLSMCIHLIVRYRELYFKEHLSHAERVKKTLTQVFEPCLYMCLTTGVAFLSLLVSGIRPVINFGWMMALGIIAAFIITFIIFPSIMMVIGAKDEGIRSNEKNPVTKLLARISLRYGRAVVLVSVLMAAFTVIGTSKLIVENSFIDYFDEQTEIHQGMTVIDQRLGGTTPLEVLINFPKVEAVQISEPDNLEDDFVDEDFFDEDFLDDDFVGGFGDDFVGEEDPEKYWFTAERVATIKKVHNYLDKIDTTGKVISLATMIEIAEEFNDGDSFSTLQLALLYSVIPQEFRNIVIKPYISVEDNQARVNVRIIDSADNLNRAELLAMIEQDLGQLLEPTEGTVQLSGMMVLYNNMLQSLFESQILTLGAVFLGIMLMFLVLFRSIKVAVIAIIPNLLAAGFVLAVMGWLAIPLDMMTITIASITIGIAVDNTIHYVVRFKRELAVDGHYQKAIIRAHASIGRAIFYTSITIIAGFSILVLSNFKPTIYFGLLTALAMFVALVGALTLLPRLMAMFKVFAEK